MGEFVTPTGVVITTSDEAAARVGYRPAEKATPEKASEPEKKPTRTKRTANK